MEYGTQRRGLDWPYRACYSSISFLVAVQLFKVFFGHRIRFRLFVRRISESVAKLAAVVAGLVTLALYFATFVAEFVNVSHVFL
jgi:hypothetical protein